MRFRPTTHAAVEEFTVPIRFHPHSNFATVGGDFLKGPRPGSLECGDSSPLLRRRLVAVEVPGASGHANVAALARAVDALIPIVAPSKFDGDKSPRESGDKSPHSKGALSVAFVAMTGFIRV